MTHLVPAPTFPYIHCNVVLMRFKVLRGSPKGKGKVQRGQYLLAVNLGRYKWYLWCPTLVREENKPPFIRVWKHSHSRRVLKFEGKHERESPKKTVSASGGSGSLQMVSEPDTGRCVNLLAILGRGLDMKWCANKNAGSRRGGGFGGSPTSIGERNECQWGRWTSKEVDCAFSLGPKEGWIWLQSHID